MASPNAPAARPGLLTTDVGASAELLRAGGLVAFPTETVYGLGADAASREAVARIYQAKGRPADHPVIVHLSAQAAADPAVMAQWAREIPAYASRLAEVLWPGPLTLLLRRAEGVGDHVTGGLPSVGLRVPSHPVAQQLLEAFGGAVAAPSANRFGRVSPTCADDVLAELGDRLVPGRDVVVDGGRCPVGVESTIVDCTGVRPRLLRPGSVTRTQLETVLSEVDGTAAGPGRVLVAQAGQEGVRAPGMLPSHYAPSARVVLAEAADLTEAPVTPTGLLAPAWVATPPGEWVRIGSPADSAEYARTLYAALRSADAAGLSVVLVVPPPDEGLGHAVRDRLRRASWSG